MADEDPPLQTATQRYLTALSEELERTIDWTDFTSPAGLAKKTFKAILDAKAAHVARVQAQAGEKMAEQEFAAVKAEVVRLGQAMAHLDRVGEPTTEHELAADNDPKRQAMLTLAELELVAGPLTPARAAEARRTIRELDVDDAVALRELVETMDGHRGQNVPDAARAGSDAAERLGPSLETLERLHCVRPAGGRAVTHVSGQPIRTPTTLGRRVFEALHDFYRYWDQVSES